MNHNLGDILRRILAIDAHTLADALEEQRAHGGKLGEALVRAGALTDEELRRALNLQAGLRSSSTTERVRAAERMVEIATSRVA